MYRFLVLLVPAVLLGGQVRYARLGLTEGKVDVQLQAADAWLPAERNLPILESSWVRTGSVSRLEIELDEGSAVRLGADSMLELSDYTRLSTGQRITVLSLDRGLAYFTGEPESRDALSLAVPGAQITLLKGARVRIEALDTFSRISVIEGVVRLTCPAAELDLREGQTVKVEPANTSRFSLEREIAAMELDRWSEERDKLLAAPASALHIPVKYGAADMDGAGEWVSTDVGMVWKPKVAEGWAPFQKGRWRWYDTVGYTWVGDEAWGFTPYHHGRWTRKNDLGWVWVPSSKTVFKPGDVYWLHGKQLAGWGPLAPGEDWAPSSAPQQFLNVNTTYAAFAADTRVIDPASFVDRPKEPLGVAAFTLALPSPAFLSSRLEVSRPVLRVGATKMIAPMVPGTTFQDNVPPPPPPEMPPAVVTNPASDAPPVVQPGPPIDPDPQAPPIPVVYPVPVYTGVVVINPPDHPDYSRRNPNQPNGGRNRNGNNGSNGNNANTPPVRGNGSNGSGNSSQPPMGRPTQPGPATSSTTPAPSVPPIAPIQPPKMEPPRVGAPAPQRTDRPRIDAPPPIARPTQPRDEPRQQPQAAPARSEPQHDTQRHDVKDPPKADAAKADTVTRKQ